MIARFFLKFGILFALAAPAAAAGLPRDCTLQRELIFDMMKAEYGAYNVWDATHGEMNTDERFASSVVVESGNAVAAGEVMAFGKPEKSVLLAEFDNRGRVVWEAAHPVKNLSYVKKLLLVPEGFVVLGAVMDKNSRAAPWLGFFDKTGKLTGQKTVAAPGVSSLVPDDMIAQTKGTGFILSASAGDEKKELFHAVIYHLDAKGAVKDSHGYQPGLDNRILGLNPVGDHYIGAGYLRGEDGRIGGWLLMLNGDGSLVWQQQYPRGRMAKLSKAASLKKDLFIAVGETEPLSGGNNAGWVMAVDVNGGALQWQRYYTTPGMDQSARDVLVNMEGMASVMMQVSKPPNDERTEDNNDFVRLLTVNERGVLFLSDEYFNAQGAEASQMIGGRAGERIITGRTDMVYKIEPKPGEPVETLKHGWDAWIVAGAPMESFSDPCLSVNAFSP
ncbi:MAG: hypothetical protein IPO54_06620 [Micavibrio sp.]|nr:hypothetical protein [Micavibrio sp.]